MTHIEVLILFTEIFRIRDEIKEWFPNGQNSVRIRFREDTTLPFNTTNEDLIFTATARDNWKLETSKSFVENIMERWGNT